MPRNVRNFWLSLSVDGRKERVETGPVRADGGFSLKILIRENGRISDTYLLITGTAREDGKLTVELDTRPTGLSGALLETNR